MFGPWPCAGMRTSEQCLDKAHDLDRRAAQCPAGEMREDFTAMADEWRRLAVRAATMDTIAEELEQP